ncbi:MAG: aromatic-ring-hydroxylating dioxygenase subunit beta [Pseudomonadota bacterium]
MRADVQAFYDEYIALLDDGEFDAWPDLFTKECFYRITTRENAEAGYDLSLICAESAGMLRDRVRALDKTMMFGPRSYRRFLSGLRVFYDNGGIQTRGNLLVIETLVDKPSQVAFCGRFEDKLICEGGNHLLEKRLIVLDTEMIPNSLIYPL